MSSSLSKNRRMGGGGGGGTMERGLFVNKPYLTLITMVVLVKEESL